MIYYKRISLVIFALLMIISSWAQVKLGFDGEESASVGIYVKELSSGKVIAQNDAEKALVPASIQKSITAAASLTVLGTDFKFETPVYLYGSKNENSWQGNLVIESCGDPTIESELFKERTPLHSTIITGLKEHGITEITGKIIIYEPMSDQGCNPCWEIEDTPWAYGAGLYGFNFQDNTYELWPATGKTVPYIPDLNLTVIKGKSNDMQQGIDSNNLTVYGKDINNPKWRLKPSMNNPALVYENLLKNKLKAAGIIVKDEETNNENTQLLVCKYESPVITEMLRECMHESHNMFAEGMLRAIAPNESRSEAVKKELSVLRTLGVTTKNNKISDGSGLARDNRLQPKFMSAVYEAMANSEYSNAYAKVFPRVGMEGTVKNLLDKTSLKGKLALKSGSMGGVQCYAGYKLDAEGKPTHTVVIMVNSFFCPRGELRGCIEKFLLETFTSK